MSIAAKYHKEIFFPNSWGTFVELFIGELSNLFESRHHKGQAEERNAVPVNVSDLRKEDVFELAFNDEGELQKVAFRIKHLSEKDDVIAVIAQDGCIVTMWRNNKNDNHKTLNKSIYATK